MANATARPRGTVDDPCEITVGDLSSVDLGGGGGMRSNDDKGVKVGSEIGVSPQSTITTTVDTTIGPLDDGITPQYGGNVPQKLQSGEVEEECNGVSSVHSTGTESFYSAFSRAGSVNLGSAHGGGATGSLGGSGVSGVSSSSPLKSDVAAASTAVTRPSEGTLVNGVSTALLPHGASATAGGVFSPGSLGGFRLAYR